MFKFIQKIAIGIIALLVIAIAVISFWPVPQELSANEKNSEIYAALVAGGIDDAVVDVTASQVIVAYELPANTDKDASLFFVMGTVAASTPDIETLKIETHSGQTVETVTVKIKDVTDMLGGRLTELQFRTKMVVTTASA
ncbi:MAG: hypothetical protein Q8R15_04940 [Candidatus Micrarchaeota archaeon]|nr:hypothetical protein [Candidatus Micrarchaeota archaeon]